MEQCPKCSSANFRKDGIVKQRQRFFCRDCHHRFTVEHIGKSNKLKRDAVILYLLGLNLRDIGEALEISHVTVHNWIKEISHELDLIKEIRSSKVDKLKNVKEHLKQAKQNKKYHFVMIDIGADSFNSYYIKKEKKHNLFVL